MRANDTAIRLAVLLLLFSTAPGCSVGPQAKDFRPATGPEGVTATLQLVNGRELQGELLEVGASGSLILVDGVILRAEWRDVREGQFEQMPGKTRVREGRRPDDAGLERLRLVSRFPQGIDAELLERLLEAYGQSEVRDALPDDTLAAIDDVLRRARTATARYRDRDTAIAAGYRKLGTDFPGMGEHWVHFSLVVRGEIDVDRPQVLSYADVGGVPTLIGVAYAAPVRDGQAPGGLPVSPELWHGHSDSIERETFGGLAGHGGPADHHGVAGESGPVLAMVHAWAWLENPDGPFAKTNWALPYLRVGWEAPEELTEASARALSLTTGGHDFVLQGVARQLQSEAGAREAVTAVVAAGRDGVRSIIGQHPPGAAITPVEVRALHDAWTRLCDEIAGHGATAPGCDRP